MNAKMNRGFGFGLLLWFLTLIVLAFVTAQNGYGSAETSAPALLPSGFLSVKGAQIIGPDGAPVRIASIGLTGMNVIGGRLELVVPFKGIEGHVNAMKATGFNCVRVDWIDRTLDDAGAMAQLDQFVAACKKAGLKVIFDNHNNEATPADWENAAQQKNGLWFDTGPGTDGTDGAGNKGTISAARFQEDWVNFAKHWAGDSTVIGFDIRNEPCAHTSTPAVWGVGGPRGIHAMYEAVGNAILAVNPDALIICEAVINYKKGAYEGDLSCVRDRPIRLTNPAKRVYSVHEYPREIGGYPGPESGRGYIDRMNKMWGWLITENVAPVWIGEMGASMLSSASQEWGTTLLNYMNGKAAGGLILTGIQQGVSGDWWAWGCLTGQNPNGCVGKDGKVRPEQAPFIDQMLFRPKAPSTKTP
jgi:aryl-phospho-beta-D-glucosidase BglC (GH1 family)